MKKISYETIGPRRPFLNNEDRLWRYLQDGFEGQLQSVTCVSVDDTRVYFSLLVLDDSDERELLLELSDDAALHFDGVVLATASYARIRVNWKYDEGFGWLIERTVTEDADGKAINFDDTFARVEPIIEAWEAEKELEFQTPKVVIEGEDQ